ncbi:MAG: HAD family hydrolase [Acidimicrobiales bacterium]
MGICSNWDWDLDRHLERTGIAEHVDFVVCSAIHGYRKPHPAIFDTVVARVEASPESILFVGDSWGDDIDGARAAGLRPVHIARQGSCPAIDVAHDDVPCVPDARAVLDLI